MKEKGAIKPWRKKYGEKSMENRRRRQPGWKNVGKHDISTNYCYGGSFGFLHDTGNDNHGIRYYQSHDYNKDNLCLALFLF